MKVDSDGKTSLHKVRRRGAPGVDPGVRRRGAPGVDSGVRRRGAPGVDPGGEEEGGSRGRSRR